MFVTLQPPPVRRHTSSSTITVSIDGVTPHVLRVARAIADAASSQVIKADHGELEGVTEAALDIPRWHAVVVAHCFEGQQATLSHS